MLLSLDYNISLSYNRLLNNSRKSPIDIMVKNKKIKEYCMLWVFGPRSSLFCNIICHFHDNGVGEEREAVDFSWTSRSSRFLLFFSFLSARFCSFSLRSFSIHFLFRHSSFFASRWILFLRRSKTGEVTDPWPLSKKTLYTHWRVRSNALNAIAARKHWWAS